MATQRVKILHVQAGCAGAIQKGDVTELLQRCSGGNPDALERLVPLVHDELRRMTDQFLHHERVDHTLQPTALVHELFLKMVDQDGAQGQERARFFSVAAKMMRRILVDHARKHITGKRGSGLFRLLTTLPTRFSGDTTAGTRNPSI